MAHRRVARIARSTTDRCVPQLEGTNGFAWSTHHDSAGAGNSVILCTFAPLWVLGFSVFVPPIVGASQQPLEHVFDAPAGVTKKGDQGNFLLVHGAPCNACLSIQLDHTSAIPQFLVLGLPRLDRLRLVHSGERQSL